MSQYGPRGAILGMFLVTIPVWMILGLKGRKPLEELKRICIALIKEEGGNTQWVVEEMTKEQATLFCYIVLLHCSATLFCYIVLLHCSATLFCYIVLLPQSERDGKSVKITA
jgi:hypothetical protein